MITLTDIQYYFIIFLLCLILSSIVKSIFSKRTTNKKGLHLPPSPPSLPLIGHLHLYSYKTLQQLSTKYGPILHLRYGATLAIHISSASLASEVFKTQDVNFAGRPALDFDKDKIIFGSSGFIGAPYGDYWRFMKKLLVTELLGTRQLDRSRSIRREEVERFLRKVMEKAQKNEAVDVCLETVKLTNNITCRMVMSTRCSEEDDDSEKIREMVKETFKKAGAVAIAGSLGPFKKLGLWLHKKGMADLTRRLDDLLERLMKEHEEKPKKYDDDKDVMDILLEFLHDDKAEFKITRNQVKALILDVFMAGTGTSSETMQWALAELINNPHMFKKAREQIESVVGSRLVEESDIQNLPYLQAIVKETLRLHPPGPMPVRESHEHCKINGFDIPAKAFVQINLYAIMRDPEYWKNPEEFYPERFLVSGNETDNLDRIKEQNFNFAPFGGGRRGCPGANLANIMINLAVAAMVQCIDWKVSGVKHGAKINMEVGSGTSMAHPLVCAPVVHFNPFAS